MLAVSISPSSPHTVALKSLCQLQNHHSHPTLPLKFSISIFCASFQAAARISMPQTFISTNHSCTYHFITTASKAASFLVQTFFLSAPLPLLLADASTQDLAEYSTGLSFNFLMSDTLLGHTILPTNTHNTCSFL